MVIFPIFRALSYNDSGSLVYNYTTRDIGQLKAHVARDNAHRVVVEEWLDEPRWVEDIWVYGRWIESDVLTRRESDSTLDILQELRAEIVNAFPELVSDAETVQFRWVRLIDVAIAKES